MRFDVSGPPFRNPHMELLTITMLRSAVQSTAKYAPRAFNTSAIPADYMHWDFAARPREADPRRPKTYMEELEAQYAAQASAETTTAAASAEK
ncbi:hypothetical protein G7K_0789-t1 [Saitoella complicata NRRL Y-17804]|uniref:Uncharacterized protein n=1 Tax=Saitoella complicata (strain BCRC 22490 / CBS 7301 / JCM 7358 / NBRC 10748 / NRRL Y-17804) TaxID=698492 RepID=A0A0E9N9Q7_SAICN|nr:hypothetical protein G7K_0789-t1 [Saitoella complicata NRRL Y-17804]